VPSWLGRRVLEGTGPAAGTPAADIQARYLRVVAGGERRDATSQLAELDAMVGTASLAGFDEVVAAVDRYRFAAATNAEPLGVAVKATTRAIYSLPFRPAAGLSESRLLNAWAAFDMAPRHSGDFEAVLKPLVEAAVAANARDVQAAVRMLVTADGPRSAEAEVRAISLAVNQVSTTGPRTGWRVSCGAPRRRIERASTDVVQLCRTPSSRRHRPPGGRDACS
jgi:hypothetical protein